MAPKDNASKRSATKVADELILESWVAVALQFENFGMDFFHGSLVLEKDVSFFLILENKTHAIEICNFSSLSKMSLLDALEIVKIVA